MVGNTDNLPKEGELKKVTQLLKGLWDDKMIGNAFDQTNYFQENVKEFGLGVRLQKDLTFTGNFWVKDVAAGRDLTKLIEKRMPKAKVFGPEKKDVSGDPNQRWVTVQAELSDIAVLLLDVMNTVKQK